MSWTAATLKDVVITSGIQTGPFGSQLHAHDYTPTGVGVVMPQDLGDNVIVLDDMARIDPSRAKSLQRHRLVPGDIVFSRRGDVTKRSLIRDRDGDLICGTGCLRVRIDRDRANPAFIAAFLALPKTKEWLVRHAVGATMPNLNTAILGAVPLRVPELATQDAIAEVLGALDDKIAANEAVIAAGRSLLLARWKELTQAATRTARLDEIAEIAPMTRLPKDRDLVPFVEMKNLPEHGLLVTHWTWADRAAGTKFRNGDTLMARITPCFENGKMALVDFLEKGEVGVGSTEYIIFRPKEDIPPILPYAVIASDDYRDFAAGRRTGTSGRQRVQTAEVGEFGIRLPEPADLAQFGGFADTLLGRLGAARTENNTLARTRDELLPQLMSGRITVKDAEKRVEEEV